MLPTLTPHHEANDPLLPRSRQWVTLAGVGITPFCLLLLVLALAAVIPRNLQGYGNIYDSVIGGDFLVFYAAGHSTIHDGPLRAYSPEHMYQLEERIVGRSTPDMPFVYPPVALFLWIPFAWLPYAMAFYAWLAATVGLQVAIAHRISKNWLLVLAVIASPLVLTPAVTGQTGIFTAVLIGGALLLLRRHPILAGALLGMLVFKPQLAVALPFCLVAGRHWKSFVSMGLSAALLTCLSVAVFGIDCWSAFFQNAGAHADDYFSGAVGMWHRIPTVVAAVQQLTGDAGLAWTVQIACGLVSLLCAAAVWHRSSDLLARSLALSAAMFLVTPKAVYYDTAVFAIPLSYLALEAVRGRASSSSILLAAVLWTLPSIGEVALRLGWQPAPLVFLAALFFACLRVSVFSAPRFARVPTTVAP